MEEESGATLMMAYVYQRGSEFENVLNAYMSNLRPVSPYDIIGTLGMSNFTNSKT